MRHKVKGAILGRKKAPREMMLRNLASSILIYEKVKTTKAKAKYIRSLVERLITVAKKGDLTARRKLIAVLPQKMAIKKTMEVLKERYKDRNGGYTRIIKLGARKGDGAEMAFIELVEEKAVQKKKKKTEKKENTDKKSENVKKITEEKKEEIKKENKKSEGKKEESSNEIKNP